MKMFSQSKNGRPSMKSGAALLAAALLSAVVPSLRAAEGPAAEPKPYTLFVGVDLAVQQDGTFHPVVGATGRGLLVESGGQNKEVASDQAGNLRISRGVKLSTATATIANVRTESVDREAARAQLEAFQSYVAMATVAGDAYDRAAGEVIEAGTHNWPVSDRDPDRATKTTNIVPALNAFEAALPGTSHDLDIAGSIFATNMTTRSTPTVQISFDLSAPQPLENAYLVVVAEYAAAGGSGSVARQVSARSLGRLDATPRAVTLEHPAAAPGYTFKRFYVGLFADGQEVATNLSNDRLALTEDQAYQFFVASYLVAHKDQTRPPAPMLMTSRADLRRRAGAVPLHADIYAKVDKNGALLALSSDAAGSVQVSAPVAAALQKVRFAPALDKGVPVAGLVKFDLASLVN